MKKNVKLFSKKGVCLMLALVLIALCFGPITNVLATSYGEGEVQFSLGITNDDNYPLNEVTINGNAWEDAEDMYLTSDGIYNIVIKVSKNEDKVPDIQWGGNWNDCITKNTEVSTDGNTYTYTLTVNKPNGDEYNSLWLTIIQGQEQQENPGDNPQEQGEVKYSVDFGTAEWEIDGVKVSAVVEFQDTINNGPVEIGDGDRIKLTNFNPETMEIIVEAEDGFNAKLELVSDDETTLKSANADGLPPALTFKVVKKDNNGEEIEVKEPIEFDIKFTNTHVNIWINGTNVTQTAGNDSETQFKGVIENAGTTNPNETNTLRLQTEFGDLPVKEYTINGKVYKEGDENVTVNKDEFIIKLAGAEKYTISGEGDSSAIVERTIIWTNPNYVPQDADDEEWIQEFKLENGYAYVIAVYDEEGNLIPQKNYASENWIVNENGGGVGSNGFGWIAIYAGSKVVFEFVPEYGYQLTDIRINGQKLGVSGLMNQFEFIMPNTNIHFDAEFTKTEDVLKANSEKVSGGSVSLGNNTLDGGSTQLIVNDVELSADKIEGFENAAGDYSISNYLDIDLYQVFYKGKDDSEDVWSNKIDELSNEVTITIKLADGVDGNDIVIVHNVHDGDKYEVIKIDSYDPETNTITFRTKSFSNYAIASKTVEKSESKEKESTEENPQTGDKLLFTTAIFMVTLAGIVVTSRKRNK